MLVDGVGWGGIGRGGVGWGVVVVWGGGDGVGLQRHQPQVLGFAN